VSKKLEVGERICWIDFWQFVLLFLEQNL